MNGGVVSGMECPLCGAERSSPSWRATMLFAGQMFRYVRCGGCGTDFCSPMPDEAMLRSMYALDYYAGRGPDEHEVDQAHDWKWVESWLRKRKPSTGLFVDYGCGDGRLLEVARAAGWDVAGVEFNAEAVQLAARTTGQRILQAGGTDIATLRGQTAILHLGDVVEHLTQPRHVLREILSLLPREAVLLAQGPLESQASVFNAFLRAKRAVSDRAPVAVAPRHVFLATAAGQQALFDRLPLRKLEFRMSEADWPAPSRFVPRMLRDPRALALLTVRRISRGLSRLAPNRLGNRYCYAGEHTGSA